MPTYIKKDAVRNLFESNGFKLVNLESGPAFVFRSKSGFSMEVPVRWLDGDASRDYELAKVRHVLNNMTDSAKREDAIYSFMQDGQKMSELFKTAKEWGMSYDDDARILICKKGRKALFTVELDYLVALKLDSCKDMNYSEIFDALRESAENDEKAKKEEKVHK
jgi:hypothetical protein